MFVEGACIAASGGVMSVVMAFAMSVWRAYGTARWVVNREIDRQAF
jgi:type IV secretion system protein VirD4